MKWLNDLINILSVHQKNYVNSELTKSKEFSFESYLITKTELRSESHRKNICNSIILNNGNSSIESGDYFLFFKNIVRFTDHPCIMLILNNQKIFIPLTNGKKQILSFFIDDKGSLIVLTKKIKNLDLGYTKIGCISVNNENGCHILEKRFNNGDYKFLELDNNLDINTLDTNSKEYKVLLNLLEKTETDSINNFKLKFMLDLEKNSKLLNVTVNNTLNNGYNDLFFEQKLEIKKRNNMLDTIFDEIEKFSN